MESTIKVIGIIVIAWLTVLTGIVLNSPKFGVTSSVATTDTLNTLRLATNDLLNLTSNFSTTTANTYTALQTFGSNITVSTTNTATSTMNVGCVQTYATSTATPVKIRFTSSSVSTTTFTGTATGGTVVWTYGNCP